MRVVCNQRDQIMSRYGSQLTAIGKKAPIALRNALNREGGKAKTAVKRAMVRQTGLRARTINKAIEPNVRRASAQTLTFSMLSRGGEVSLKFFRPKETKAGVKHSSPNLESPQEGTFTKGGRFGGKRYAKSSPVTTGHVWMRDFTGKWPLVKIGSNVWIPKEMISGDSRQQWTLMTTRLGPTLEKQIARWLPG